MSLDAIPTTDLFDTFTKTLCVGYDNVPLVVHYMVSRLGIAGAPFINLSGRPVKSFLHLAQSPLGIFALSESLPEVILFLLEQLRIAAHSGGPMGEGLDNTELGQVHTVEALWERVWITLNLAKFTQWRPYGRGFG